MGQQDAVQRVHFVTGQNQFDSHDFFWSCRFCSMISIVLWRFVAMGVDAKYASIPKDIYSFCWPRCADTTGPNGMFDSNVHIVERAFCLKTMFDRRSYGRDARQS